MNDEPTHETTPDWLPVVIPPTADVIADATKDEVGPISDFIRRQPVLTLSIAFGLGLLVTSLLARKPT